MLMVHIAIAMVNTDKVCIGLGRSYHEMVLIQMKRMEDART